MTAHQLAPGDGVRLWAGDVVPADCRLLETSGLKMDESCLSGEALALPVAGRSTEAGRSATAERTRTMPVGSKRACAG